MVVLLLVAFGVIILFEVPGLIHKAYWRELIAFSVLLGLGFGLSLLLTLEVELPSITLGILRFMETHFEGLLKAWGVF